MNNRPVFLSHAAADRDAAHALAGLIKDAFNVQVFVSTIQAGADFRLKISDELRNCKVAVALITRNSLHRDWVHFEAGAITALNKPVIPVCVGEITKEHLPGTLQNLQACEYETDLHDLFDAIAQHLPRRPTAAEVKRIVDHKPDLHSQVGAVAPDAVRHFDTRGSAHPAIRQIFTEASHPQGTLSIAGIANSDLYGPRPWLNEHLTRALDAGAKVRLIFLHPDSPAAKRRSVYEYKRLHPRTQIVEALSGLSPLCGLYPDQFQIRLVQDISPYLCFNDSNLVMHPYLASAVGDLTRTLFVSASDPMYAHGKKHFETIWPDPWILFDLGNVLVGFEHRRVAKALVRYLKTSSNQRKPGRDEGGYENSIHRFIFEPTGAGESLEHRLNCGKIQLPYMLEQLRQRFSGLRLDMDEFSRAWCGIFEDELDDRGMGCLEAIQPLAKIAICSDTNPEHWAAVRALHPRLDVLAKKLRSFLSFELGVCKADRPGASDSFFARIVTGTHRVKGTERPYDEHALVDDKEENRSAATVAGMHAFDSALVDAAALETFLHDNYRNSP